MCLGSIAGKPASGVPVGSAACSGARHHPPAAGDQDRGAAMSRKACAFLTIRLVCFAVCRWLRVASSVNDNLLRVEDHVYRVLLGHCVHLMSDQDAFVVRAVDVRHPSPSTIITAVDNGCEYIIR
jgi:hypothetical protein